ncbi:polysaccharide pyruvyl transferase family protein [Zhihengliuella sp.]|uniref:polysaccharide pyruvyl transferase family protein n=1 Tax=Zhihengliuella sp. TaxID=1954483 RepID=UPI002810E5D3|nr:polysaccharide pyruvyl transferase family protein [Zhihengliuella sp.]
MVELYEWNPRRPVLRGPVGRLIPLRRPVNNFGDLLGPRLVERMLASRSLDPGESVGSERLFTVGSVMHEVAPGDHVWGSGVNGKELARDYSVAGARIHAVRGELTKSFLEARGASVPAVFGDPGILTARYFPSTSLGAPLFRADYTVVPNLHDYRSMAGSPNVLNPRAPLLECLATIANSRFVVGSSLHGLIVAEAYGVPARRMVASTEPDFKYDDYYSGTGRAPQRAARSVDEALSLGASDRPEFDCDGLVASFPWHLWRGGEA